MDASLIDLLTQLKIIGMLRAHERFSTKGSMIRIEQQTRFLTPVVRWLFGEDRENNMHQLQAIFDKALNMLNLKQGDEGTFLQIFRELEGAKDGLVNLQATYEGDSVSIAKLQIMIDMLNRKLEAYTSSQSRGGSNGSSSKASSSKGSSKASSSHSNH